MSRYENFMFPDQGSDEANADFAEKFRRREAWLDEGWCANGCGPRVPSEDFEGMSECPACGFSINRPAVTGQWGRDETMSEHETREFYGQVVRAAWVNWALEQPDPKPSWLAPWADLDESDREADRRIGDAMRNAVTTVEIKRLTGELDEARATITQLVGERDGLESFHERIVALVDGYSWLADGRGDFEWDDPRYDADVRAFVQSLRDVLPVTRWEPWQTVLRNWNRLIEQRDALAALVVELRGALERSGKESGDYSDCAYFAGTGTCSFSCVSEPSCHTDRPAGGWPKEQIRAALALDTSSADALLDERDARVVEPWREVVRVLIERYDDGALRFTRDVQNPIAAGQCIATARALLGGSGAPTPCECSPGDICSCAYDCDCRERMTHIWAEKHGWKNIEDIADDHALDPLPGGFVDAEGKFWPTCATCGRTHRASSGAPTTEGQ